MISVSTISRQPSATPIHSTRRPFSNFLPRVEVTSREAHNIFPYIALHVFLFVSSFYSRYISIVAGPAKMLSSVRVVLEVVKTTYVRPLIGAYPFGVAGTVALNPALPGRRVALVQRCQYAYTICSCTVLTEQIWAL